MWCLDSSRPPTPDGAGACGIGPDRRTTGKAPWHLADTTTPPPLRSPRHGAGRCTRPPPPHPPIPIQILLDVQLPRCVYKKLLSLPLGLEDLKAVDPAVGASMQAVLDYPGEDVEVCVRDALLPCVRSRHTWQVVLSCVWAHGRVFCSHSLSPLFFSLSHSLSFFYFFLSPSLSSLSLSSLSLSHSLFLSLPLSLSRSLSLFLLSLSLSLSPSLSLSVADLCDVPPVRTCSV
jgi:hypothetical protein